MKIAIVSDIHDNIWNLNKVVSFLPEKVEALICLGDFCAPFSAQILGSLDMPIHACLGNNDEDQIALVKQGDTNFVNWISLAEEFGTAEFDNRKIAFCHYPKLAELLAKSGEFDAVFHGHTHVPEIREYGKSLLANPGSVCGIQKGRPGYAGFGIYDTKTNKIELIDLETINS